MNGGFYKKNKERFNEILEDPFWQEALKKPNEAPLPFETLVRQAYKVLREGQDD